MSGIYRWATRVLVWLGESGQESDMLIDLLNDSKGDFGLVWRSPGQLCKPRVEVTVQTMGTVVYAFHSLCSRAYWTRVWIIQEILSASSLQLYCGRKSLSWAHFGAAFASLKIIPFATHKTIMGGVGLEAAGTTPAALIHSEWVHYRTLGQTISLRKLIDLCARCKSKCQDVRDRIYGVISIADDKKGLTPDYTKTELELYVEFLQIFIPVYEENIRFSIKKALRHTRHIIFLVKQLNQLLCHPAWNESMNHFFTYPETEMIRRRLPTIRPTARIYFANTTRVIDTSSVMNSENRKRHYFGMILEVGRTELKWDQLPLGRRSTASAFWWHLKEPDLHRTNFIGGLYSRDPTSYTYMRVPEYEKEESVDGHIRIFTTIEGSLGIASHKVEKDDLLCFSDAPHQVGFIIRASAYPLSCASTFRLIGQVIMLDTGPLSTEASFRRKILPLRLEFLLPKC